MLCRRDSTQVLSRKRSSHKGPLSSRSQPPQVQVTNQRHVLHDKHQHLRNPTPFRPRPSSINYPVNLGSLPRCLPLRRRSLYEERNSLGHSILGFLDLFGRWGVGGYLGHGGGSLVVSVYGSGVAGLRLFGLWGLSW